MTTLSELRQEPHWSASSLNGLLNICSLQWAFRHVYEVEPESTALNLVFGRAFHAACEYVVGGKGDARFAKDCLDVFVSVFDAEVDAAEAPIGFDKHNRGSVIDLADRMLQAYANGLDHEEEVVGMAIPFKAQLHDTDEIPVSLPLIGEIDLLTRKDDKLTVVDWKTSASRWPKGKPDKSLQATAYLFAMNQKTGSIPDFRFDVVTKTQKPAYERYPTARSFGDFHRLAELVRVADGLVQRELFVPNEQSFACKGCPYKSACRQWHRNRSTLILNGLAA